MALTLLPYPPIDVYSANTLPDYERGSPQPDEACSRRARRRGQRSGPERDVDRDAHVGSKRNPSAAASGGIATLAETWRDSINPGGSGATFGSLSALTAGGRGVSVSTVNSRTVRATFRPNADGTFRVVVGAPHWAGGNPATTASQLLGTDATAPAATLRAATLAWWHGYWAQVGMLKLGSTNGEAEYLENLRNLNLFTQAASSGDRWPASHGGVANLFDFNGDGARWCTYCYWHWNLRMEVAANLGAGAFNQNAPFFSLYRDNLANMQAWTKAQMGGRDGICIPETVRYKGNGYYIADRIVSGASCKADIAPKYNARTLSLSGVFALNRAGAVARLPTVAACV
jgi:hypothetical protein